MKNGSQRETMLRWYDELSPEYQELIFRFVRGLRLEVKK